MTPSQVTFEIRGTLLLPGEVFAICGSCDALGNWNPQNAVALLPESETGECMLWKAAITLSRGVSVQYRYFRGCFLEPKKVKSLLMTDNLESTMVLKHWILDGSHVRLK
ncbi:Gpcpd1 [Phodopus roborovskii]|uniref:Gpcpd1 protein n=1 Tax=Phodopus roborovskii TaxID=109678 RepID=A0AAU9Z749_PHORO|nr:Gpcpd1 [Phodopus roborovskii]